MQHTIFINGRSHLSPPAPKEGEDGKGIADCQRSTAVKLAGDWVKSLMAEHYFFFFLRLPLTRILMATHKNNILRQIVTP